MAGLAAVSVAVSATLAGAADVAAGEPSVTIVSPAPDSVVGGDVEVRLHVESTPERRLTSVVTTLGVARVSTDLSADPACATACDVTVVVPTGGWTEPTSESPTYDGDGRLTLVASASDGFGTVHDSHVVELDNDRPTVSAPDLPTDGTIGLSATTALRVRAAALATGPEAVSEVRLYIPWAEIAGRTARVDLTREDSGSWVGSLDTSAWPGGYVMGYLVAIDAAGTASTAERVPFVVSHGLPLTAAIPTWVEAGEEDTALRVTADARGYPTTWPVSYELQVDGRTVYETEARELWNHPLSWGRAMPVLDLPNGEHLVEWVVTDNRGGVARTGRTVTVDFGPTVTVTPTTTVRSQGGTLKVAATAMPGANVGVTVVNVDAVSPTGRRTVLRTWQCQEGVNCTGARVELPLDEPYDVAGTWYLDVVTRDTSGATRLSRKAVQVAGLSASRLTVSASRVTYGAAVRLTATVYRDGKVLPYAPVRLQFKPNGSTTWTDVATGTTASNGSAAFSRMPSGRGSWRIYTPARAGQWAASYSGAPTVDVLARIASTTAPTTVYRNTATTWRWKVTPVERNLRATVQVRKGTGSWVTVSQPLVASDGTVSASLRFSSAGTWSVRVVRPTTTRITGTSWATSRTVR